jgi:hypothetical protein
MNKGWVGDGNHFIGQVAPNQMENEVADNGHGFRVRVRILGVHSLDAEIRNEDLPLAIVKMPTTHGSLNRLSCGLIGGEIVTGYFLDSKRQIPVIDGVLGRSITKDEITAQQALSAGTTYGQRLKIDSQTGMTAGPHQTVGGASPNSPATPTREEMGAKTPPAMQSDPVVTNEFGQPLSVATNGWDGDRNSPITKETYNSIINSNSPTTTDSVKSDAARAAYNSGIITQDQWLEVSKGL